MEPPNALRAVAPGAQQLRYGIPVSERAAQPSKIVLVVRQHMSPTQVEQLDAVLECATVDELQNRHRELDVAQSALAQLEFPILISGRNVSNHALAHGLSVGDEVLPLRGAPDHRRDHLHE